MDIMSDDHDLLSEAHLCRVAGVSRTTRGRWVGDGLFDDPDEARATRATPDRQERYGRVDLLRLVGCSAVMKALGPSDGKTAWRQVRGMFVENLTQERLEVVWSEGDELASLVTNDGELAQAVRLGRPVLVIDLTADVHRATDAFSRVQAEYEATSRAKAKRRPTGDKRSSRQSRRS